MTDASSTRRAGLLVPLFASPSTLSWGIGEIPDLVPLTGWLAAAGARVLQLLPLNEMAAGQQSPYSALSALAVDPIYVRLADVPEFVALGGEAALASDDRRALAAARAAHAIDYANVRRLKQVALGAAFDRFVDAEWRRDTNRARALRRFVATEAWWIEDYALFRAIHAREGERPWTAWAPDLRERHPPALDRVRHELRHEVLFRQYVQWLAATQWRVARAQTHGVALFGDLPFMVDGDSADVWARQPLFDLDASVGVPPDAFSDTGQDWGMPVYRWDAMAADDFSWLRDRARRSADLYDGYRVDHLVGFYRTYGRPRRGGDPFFTPSVEVDQVALGETLLGLFRAAGCQIIAEDLGVVPDFVRASLARLGVPGYRVFRWERDWGAAGQPFVEPTAYPPVSVATSGTHDTEPLALWWALAPEEERQAIGNLAAMRALSGDSDVAGAPFNPQVRDWLLEALYASGSDLLLLPVQDVFGWSDRINVPATVNEVNWTYRLPWPCDRLGEVEEARERQAALSRWAARHGRR